MSNRRDFIKKGALLTALGLVATKFSQAETDQTVNNLSAGAGEYTLPDLGFKFDALEPYIDAQTMQIHHDRHHKAYVDNLNKAIASLANEKEFPALEALMAKISTYPVSIRNNGGGHYNHSLFWQLIKPGGGQTPPGKIAEAINSSFGNFETFKKQFTEAALTRFGSGWAWLIKQNDKLVIGSTPNQDNPLMDASDLKGIPLLAIDVWEHAYYLKYQNKRADYVSAWWNVINWDEVAKRL